MCTNKLYFLDTTSPQSNHFNQIISAYSPVSLLQTVNSKNDFFTKQEIAGADEARLLQDQLGWPNSKSFKDIVPSNFFWNSGVAIDNNVKKAQVIYGPPVPLKGSIVRQDPA